MEQVLYPVFYTILIKGNRKFVSGTKSLNKSVIFNCTDVSFWMQDYRNNESFLKRIPHSNLCFLDHGNFQGHFVSQTACRDWSLLYRTNDIKSGAYCWVSFSKQDKMSGWKENELWSFLSCYIYFCSLTFAFYVSLFFPVWLEWECLRA